MKVAEHVKRADDADQNAIGINHEHTVYFQRQHFGDDIQSGILLSASTQNQPVVSS
jgi:hypothetical protein